MRSTGSSTSSLRRGAVRALSLTGAVTALLTPVLIAGAGTGAPSVLAASAGTTAASTRASTPPNVTYPIAAKAKPQDLRSYRGTAHHGTEIEAPCGTPVLAAHPGTVRITTAEKWSGTRLVRVYTTAGRLTTWYGFMRSAAVTDGQIVQAGQQIGEVGAEGVAKGCELHFEVRNDHGKTLRNPTGWLDRYVGSTVPATFIFGNRGFLIASFNTLGATHTATGGDAPSYPGYKTRTPKAIAVLKNAKIDVAGLQEFQKPQHEMFRKQAGGTFALYPADERTDTENSITWRRSSFDLVSGHTFKVTYFNGSTRNMPYVLLRQRTTGLTAYFINVHNPANTRKYRHQEKYRAQAIQAERALIVKLRATGRPVFLTGDLNDRKEAYCPLSTGKLLISPDAVPSMECALPPKAWIDWVLGAGQVRFATYVRDWSTRDHKITDHPIVYARAHLAG